MVRPNLFRFAVSELAQDAFICWLASWANPAIETPDPSLKKVSENFIAALLRKHDKNLDKITHLEIIRQKHKLDIFIRINEKMCLLIEDKVYAKEGKNQLEKYLIAFQKEYPNDVLLGIYLKTGNQGTHVNGGNAFKGFWREDLIPILEQGALIENDIFQDFYAHVLQIENATQSYQTTPINQWSILAWQGFYSHLQKNGFQDWQWAYVSNPDGGFTGLWSPRYSNGCHIQLEQQKYKAGENPLNPKGKPYKRGMICLKCVSEDKENTALRARYFSEQIKISVIPNGLEIPSMRKGQHMTFARSKDYRVTDEQGIIKLTETINLIREYENTLKKLT